MDDYALKFDGSQNYLNLGTLGNLGSNLGSGFFLEFKIKTTITATRIWGVSNSTGNQQMFIYLNADRSTANVAGLLSFLFVSPAGSSILGGTYLDTSFNDGKVHTVKFLATMNPAVVRVFVDNVEYSVNYSNQSNLSGFINFDRGFYLGARDQGAANSHTDCSIDGVKIGTSPTDLYGSYSFSEGTGSTTANNVTSGASATLVGSPLPSWIPGYDYLPKPRYKAADSNALARRNSRVNPIGISANLPVISIATFKTWLPAMKAAGIRRVRSDFLMSEIQATQGVWTFTKYDDLINTAASYDIEILPIAELYGMPAWAVGGGTPGFLHPITSIYQEFVRKIAERYKGMVYYIQLGNEPNATQYWPVSTGVPAPSPAGPSAAEYVPYVQAGYIGAKTGNPEIKVITAGLLSSITSGGNGIGTYIYLKAMYDAGVKGYYDLLGAHGYGLKPFDNPLTTDAYQDSKQMLISYRQMQIDYGDEAPMALTEWGWPTHSGAVVTQDEQAYNIKQMFDDIMFGDLQFVKMAFLYKWNDDNTGTANAEENYGIVKSSGSSYAPKAGYQSFLDASIKFNNYFTEKKLR